MPLEIKKEERESSQSLVRRFSRRVKLSGILMRARKLRYHTRGKSRNMMKKSALRREELRKEYEEQKKLGKIKE